MIVQSFFHVQPTNYVYTCNGADPPVSLIAWPFYIVSSLSA